MSSDNFSIVCWNVRGLNAAARVLTVHEMIKTMTAHIVCLQETKLQTIDRPLALFLGAYKFDNFAFKPAQGTKGGILILWNEAAVELGNQEIGRYSISGDVTLRHSSTTFRLTTVYGSSRRLEKEVFLRHLCAIKPSDDIPWLLLGDFNLKTRTTIISTLPS